VTHVPIGDARPAKVTWRPATDRWVDTVGDVPSDVFVWAAGEADVMRGLRSYLRDGQRLETRRISIHAYRRVGVAQSLPREGEA
jgi:NADPH-dependent ferric siderophore reductase